MCCDSTNLTGSECSYAQLAEVASVGSKRANTRSEHNNCFDSFINTELSLVADQLGQQPRTRKAATRFYDNQIKAELLAKAMVDKVPKVVVERET